LRVESSPIGLASLRITTLLSFAPWRQVLLLALFLFDRTVRTPAAFDALVVV